MAVGFSHCIPQMYFIFLGSALEITVGHRTFSDHFMHLSEKNLLRSVILSERWQAHDRRCTREWNYHMGWAVLTRHNFMHTCVRASMSTMHAFHALTMCFFYVRSTFIALCVSHLVFLVLSYFRSPFDACNNFAWRLSRLQSMPGLFDVVRMQQSQQWNGEAYLSLQLFRTREKEAS